MLEVWGGKEEVDILLLKVTKINRRKLYSLCEQVQKQHQITATKQKQNAYSAP